MRCCRSASGGRRRADRDGGGGGLQERMVKSSHATSPPPIPALSLFLLQSTGGSRAADVASGRSSNGSWRWLGKEQLGQATMGRGGCAGGAEGKEWKRGRGGAVVVEGRTSPHAPISWSA